MSAELTAARDHARAMSTAEHKPGCEVRRGFRMLRPDPACPGCVTEAERVQWAAMADEMDAHLARDEVEDLFGEVGATNGIGMGSSAGELELGAQIGSEEVAS